jgi:hypothetical protein
MTESVSGGWLFWWAAVGLVGFGLVGRASWTKPSKLFHLFFLIHFFFFRISVLRF